MTFLTHNVPSPAHLGQVQEFVDSLGVPLEMALLSLFWKLVDEWPCLSSLSSRITAVLYMILKGRSLLPA
jgi:hypothetical protein